MPVYSFKCECGEVVEVVRSMENASDLYYCICGKPMQRDFKADNIMGSGKDYRRPIHSDSLAITPSQVAEHQKLFPRIEIDSQCRPVFNNFTDHENYLKKTGFVKNKQKIKIKGKKIS